MVIHRHEGECDDALILLVHGLGGSRYGYFAKMPEFLFEDFPFAAIGLMDYRTLARRWNLFQSTSLEDTCVRFRQEWEQSFPKFDRVVIIVHSLGGLMTMNTMGLLAEQEKREAIRKVRLIVLADSPRLGSWVASAVLVAFFGAIALAAAQAWAGALTAVAALGVSYFLVPDVFRLATLSSWQQAVWRRWADKFEGADPKYTVPVKATIAQIHALIVGRHSAGIAIPTDDIQELRYWHGDTVRPTSRLAKNYTVYRDWLSEALGAKQTEAHGDPPPPLNETAQLRNALAVSGARILDRLAREKADLEHVLEGVLHSSGRISDGRLPWRMKLFSESYDHYRSYQSYAVELLDPIERLLSEDPTLKRQVAELTRASVAVDEALREYGRLEFPVTSPCAILFEFAGHEAINYHNLDAREQDREYGRQECWRAFEVATSFVCKVEDLLGNTDYRQGVVAQAKVVSSAIGRCRAAVGSVLERLKDYELGTGGWKVTIDE